MTHKHKNFKLKELFAVRSGDFHAVKELEPGEIPLISCGDYSNGLVGYFDIPEDKIHERRITVAYNGSWPLMAKFHPYKFGTKDDVAVLVPLTPMSDGALLYVAASLDRMVWRYHYGRKCYQEKMGEVTLSLPIVKNGRLKVLDESLMDNLLRQALAKVSSDVSNSIIKLV